MNFEHKIFDGKGNELKIEVLGFFEVPELKKEYVMYSIVDDDPERKYGSVVLGEVVRTGDKIEILDIRKDEIDLVVAFYNEISTQIGEDNNG